MTTRRDQVQAHRFIMSRLTAGLQRLDPDTPDSPTRRTQRGILLGTIVAALVAAGFGLYGAIVPGGSTSWRKDATVVLDKDSGARLLYLNGELHPLLNQTSARLLAGDHLRVQTVRSRSLRGTPQGGPIGIVGAPEALPDTGRMVTGAWAVCAGQLVDGTGRVTTGPTTVAIGAATSSPALASDQGLLVTGPDSTAYLLWNGQRLRIDTTHGALAGLGYHTVTAVPVTAATLNAIPAGADLASPEISQNGQPGVALAGRQTRIGQLFVGAGEHDRYVLVRQGLVPLTETLFTLLRGDPRTQVQAYQGSQVTPATIGPDDVARHTAPEAVRTQLVRAGALPESPPTLRQVRADQAVCIRLQPAAAGAPAATVTVVEGEVLAGGRSPTLEPGVTPACRQADRVVVAGRAGAVVRALSAAGGIEGLTYLVTDAGVKYPVSTSDAAALGYRAIPVVRMPAAVLSLLPTGPVLSRQALQSTSVVEPLSGTACVG